MLLTRYNPLAQIAEFEKRLFNKYNDTYYSDGISDFTPTVNTREGEYAFHIDADLPGVKKEEIKIDVRDGVLTIYGERNHKEEVKEEDYYKIETSFGKFQRSFTLPSDIDSENITASTNNGVLEVTVPKLEKKESTKRIEIK